MIRNLIIAVTLIALAAGVWYFFLMEGDVSGTFRLHTTPGTVNQSAKLWIQNQEGASNFEQVSSQQFGHDLELEGSRYRFAWNVKVQDDTTSVVRVSVTEPSRSFMNRLQRPFLETGVEQVAQTKLKDFFTKAREHLDRIRVEVLGETVFDSAFCVYTPIKTSQLGKAGGMMQNYSFISNFIVSEGLTPTGMPIVEIVDWDQSTDEIAYNLCYPIAVQDSLPEQELLSYKWIPGFKALKANYFGNYITSDRAWYALEQYARKNNYKVDLKPVEVFFNNPNIDSEERKWKAEVFMPIIDTP